MRIGYYIPGWPPGSVPNGIVSTLGRLGAQLREAGHEVFYITPFTNEPLDDDNVIVLDTPSSSSLLLKLRYHWDFERTFYAAESNRIAYAVRQLVQTRNLDIFQMEETHGWARSVIEKIPIPVGLRLGGPWFLHGDLAPTETVKPENRHRIVREGRAIHCAAGIQAASNSVLELTAQYYGAFKCPTRVIRNPIAVKPESARWELSSCDRDLILFVGRFDHHKGADVLVKAFAMISKERPGLRLLFVGPDVGLVTSTRQVKFAEFIAQEIPAEVRTRIRYCGQLNEIEIGNLRRRAFMTVICSRYEVFGNTVIEAMAAGCPIVATNVGGIPELITHGLNGLLSPAADLSGLATCFCELLDNPDLAARLGRQAALDCADQFSPTKIARQTIEYYSTIIESHEAQADPTTSIKLGTRE